MNSVDPHAFEFAMSHIKDGNIFERFAQNLLCQVLGVDFIPVGGHKDGGLDGVERCFEANNVEQTIYQISIEADPETKVKKTLRTLKNNKKKYKLRYRRLIYVTNQTVRNQDTLINEFFNEFKVSVTFYDLAWL